MIKFRIGAMIALLWTCAFALPGVVLSHSNEYLATQDGPNGGMLRASGPYHLELLVDRGEVRVWVTDHADQPRATAGARGQLMVMQGDERFIVELVPAGENMLEGSDTRVPSAEGLRAILTLAMSGQAPLQVRFAPMDAAASQPAGYGAHDHALH